MSQSHLCELYNLLVQRGWKVSEYRESCHAVDVLGAAVWEVRRYEDGPAIVIDFPGFGEIGEDIPLEESYACNVRDQPISLYFSRVNRSRDKWLEQLTTFVEAIEQLNVE